MLRCCAGETQRGHSGALVLRELVAVTKHTEGAVELE